MNNQLANMSSYHYFAHMYANYLYYKSQNLDQIQHFSFDFFNYVLPIIINDMNPFIYDDEFSVDRVKLESRMQSLESMVGDIVDDMNQLPNDLFKTIVLSPIINEWVASSNYNILSEVDHVRINLIFKTLTKLLIHINKDYLLYKYNVHIVTDYDNNNKPNSHRVDGGSKNKYFNKKNIK